MGMVGVHRLVLLASLGAAALGGEGCLYTKNRVNDFFDTMSIGTGGGVGVSARATHYVQAGALMTGRRIDTQGFRMHPLLFPFALQAYYFPSSPPPVLDAGASATAETGAFAGIGYVKSEVETGIAYELGVAPLVYSRSIDLQETMPDYRVRKIGTQTRTVILGRTILDAEKDRMWKRWSDGTIWKFYPGVEEYIGKTYDRRFFDLGASAYLGVGLDLDLDLYELSDFFLGFFGVDFANDDGIAELPTAEEKEEDVKKR